VKIENNNAWFAQKGITGMMLVQIQKNKGNCKNIFKIVYLERF